MARDSDLVHLIAGGLEYKSWMTAKISRAIDRMCSSFSLEVSEAWATENEPWAILPYTPVQLLLGDTVVMTGYVDDYTPSFDGMNHRVAITGRGKTQDITDCMPDVPSGQFKGYTLDAIARALCAPFGIGVVVAATLGENLQDTTMERAETDYSFLERLGRLSGVLFTDDENGNLVLAQTGTARATDALAQGVNIIGGNGKLSGGKRFSQYTLKGQHGISAVSPSVQTSQQAIAYDPGVPRYRPHVAMAESQLDQAGMQARVTWQARYAAARGAEANVTVRGWRQSDGSLWQLNTLVACTIPYLRMDQDMLIVGVDYTQDASGTRTDLRLGDPAGYTPDPAQVKLYKKHGTGKGGTGNSWSGAGGIK